MTACSAPTSCMVCPVEGSTLPIVFYRAFKLVSSLSCKYCFCSKYCLCIYSDVAWDPVSRFLGGIEHPETLIYICQCSVIIIVTSSFTACSSKYCSCFYLRGGLRSSVQSPGLTRTTKYSAHLTNTSVCQENTSISQESSTSEQEMEVQSPCFQLSTSQAQFVPPLFMPYTEGPKMDWTVNDGLYHRILKWKLKCENILDCGLAMLSASKKCKKVMAWSRDFGMDSMLTGACLWMTSAWKQYELSMKNFANHKQMKSGPDLTCLQASGKEIDQ